MNNIVPLRAAAAPAAFAGRNLPDMNSAAQQGITASFAVIGYKGRNWRIKYRSEDTLLKDAKGLPIPELPPVVIVGVSPSISKIFYEKKYSEGDDEAPDCWSSDGITPDASVAKKQCDNCALCPQNQWGVRVTEAGKKAKACQDNRRIAVVPVGDVENETFGGPMMLRVPPMSLQNLARYTADLKRYGAQPYMVSTVLGFDYDVAYPLLTFRADGWLDEATAQQVVEALENPQIDRILATEVVEAPAPVGALAAGGPPAAFQGVSTPDKATMAQADSEAAAKRAAAQAQVAAKLQADAEAKAREEALVLAQAQAEASRKAAAMQAEMERREAEAAAAAAAAAPPKKVSPFGAPAAAPASAPAAAAAPPASAAPKPTTKAKATTVVAQAPEDLENAIDSLLAD